MLMPIICLMPNYCLITPIVDKWQILDGRIGYFENIILNKEPLINKNILILYNEEQKDNFYL